MTWLEFKKSFLKKSFLTLILLLFIFLAYYSKEMMKYKEDLNFKNVSSEIDEKKEIITKYLHPRIFFSFIAQIIIIYCASNNLVNDFKLGTSTFIFSSKKKRHQVLFYKISSIVLLSLVFAFLNSIFNITVCKILETNVYSSFFELAINSMIHTWFICNFVTLLVIIFRNNIVSFITSIFLIFVIHDLVLTIKEKSKYLKKIFELLSLDMVFSFITLGNIDINIYRLFFTFFLGTLFFLISCLLFNNQDLS